MLRNVNVLTHRSKTMRVKSAAGVLYKAITICPSLEVIEDIRKWSKEE